MTIRTVKWIRTTIAEPFPVFYGHVSQKSHRCGEAEGPFYSEGSRYCTLYSAKTLKWKQQSAEGLRKNGYTVTVEVIEKPTHVYGPRNSKAECFA